MSEMLAVVEDSHTRKQERVLSELDELFAISGASQLAKLVHTQHGNSDSFQRWFRYREGFSPQLVEQAIGQLSIPCTLVLDPFCGVGSSLLASRNAGIPSIGMEINPVVATVTRAKTYNYSSADMDAIKEVVRQLSEVTEGMPQAERPLLSILPKIFREDVLAALLTTRNIIDKTTQGHLKDFLLTGWLAVLEGVSNVFKEGNGIKYRNRKRTSYGYITVPWEAVPSFGEDGWGLVKTRLAIQYGMMLDDIEKNSDLPIPEVRETSCIKELHSLAPESVTLSIFSPPYCNNFNYMKIFKVELWMSGMVSTYGDIRVMSARAVRSHVEMTIDISGFEDLPTPLRKLVSMIDQSRLWNKKIPKTILAYFIDMKAVLAGIYRALQVNGECHIVVGNSAYGGVVIPTDTILALIAREIGFSVESIQIARHLTTSSQQRASLQPVLDYLRESVVVLKKET
jgi:hypothetical protein